MSIRIRARTAQIFNLSETESVVAVIARTDPNEQESVVLLPALDRIRASKIKKED